MSLRVCMIAYTHYRSDSRPRREAEALAARGDVVDFLALSNDGDRHDDVLNGVRLIDLPVKRYRGQTRGSYVASYMRFFRRASKTLLTRHLAQPYDIVWVHTLPDFMVFATAAARALGAKVVLDVHDTMPELYQSKFGVAPGHPLIKALSLQEKVSCNFADAVICVHEPHRQLLLSRGIPATKLTSVLNLPDPNLFGHTEEPRGDSLLKGMRPRLVYHGTIAKRLGLDTALHAFATVVKDIPNAQFDIFGTGDFAPEVKRLITDLKLDDHVHFPNQRFKVDDVPDLLRGAAAGIVPNRKDAATQIMLPVKLMEYVHLGIPCAAPRLRTIQHYFDDRSVAYYEPGDIAALSTVLRNLLTDSGMRQRMRRDAWQFTRDYSWDAMRQRLYSVADSLQAS